MSTTVDPVRQRMAEANPAPIGVEPPGDVMTADALLAVVDDRSGDMAQTLDSPEQDTSVATRRMRRNWVAAFAAGFAVVLIAGFSFGLLIRVGDPVDVVEPVTTSTAETPTTVAPVPTTLPVVEPTVAPTVAEEPATEVDAPMHVEPAIEPAAISSVATATISRPVIESTVVPMTGNDSRWAATTLVSSDAVINDSFGESVAVDGDRIVVGAPIKNIGGEPYAGAVYLFEADDNGRWAETRLTASDNSEGAQFGMAVAVEGDRVAVGASEVVYVFDRDSDGSWIETKLTAADGADGDVFGSSVAVDGDWVVVGAGGVNDDTGAVYVFEQDGNGDWAGTKLTASDGAPRTYFGFHLDRPLGMPVAVDGGRIVVGSRPLGGPSTVYVYEPDGAGGWTETKLADFGFGVDIDGDRIVISDESAVHVFEPDGNDGWTQTEVMISDRTPEDPVLRNTQSMGSPVATADSALVFASFPIDTEFISTVLGEVDPAEQMGPVYIFNPDGDNKWTETALNVSPNNQIIGFVFTVAADGDRVVVGATGGIYVYEHTQN